MARRGGEFRFGLKLAGVLAVAAVCGFVWAMVESGRGPQDIAKAFRNGDAPGPKPEPVPEPKPGPPVRDREKPAPTPEPPRPDPPKPPPKTYSPAEMQTAFREVENFLRVARFREARERCAALNKQLVPPDQAGRLRDLETRAEAYQRLIVETTPGAAVPMPAISELWTTAGTRPIFVKNVSESGGKIAYETVGGIRGSVARSDVRELTALTKPGQAAGALDHELEQTCASRGVTVARDAAGWTFVANGRVTGLSFFDLADFCARNGHNARVATLFDEALRRDPDLLRTVREAKAERMVNVFYYFLGLRSRSEAASAYGVLTTRYPDARAFRDRVLDDAEIMEQYEVLIGKRAPRPAPTAPTEPPPSEPPPTEPPAGEGTEPPPAEPDTPLPDQTPEAAARLVKRGDGLYEDGMKHLRASDPNRNPSGWAAENRKALELFGKAFEAYETAQNEYEKARRPIPSSLLKRIRETQMNRSLCRKRAVSTK